MHVHAVVTRLSFLLPQKGPGTRLVSDGEFHKIAGYFLFYQLSIDKCNLSEGRSQIIDINLWSTQIKVWMVFITNFNEVQR